jgi:hypothetical protein
LLLLSIGGWCITALEFDVWSIVESTFSIEGNGSERVGSSCNDNDAIEL